MEAMQQQVLNLTQPSTVTDLPSELTKLIKCIEQLTKIVGARPRNSRSRSQGPPQPHSRSSFGTKLCWYHRRFSEKASKCIAPCSWTAGNKQGNGQSNQ
ncbi:unnamed protein product [Pieris macdunnoughi]|uniref:Uncharacterized protein n=1 Tax=Pieris macdunnoughi TaxID=345717 RepID=A0A821XRR1_9NEOP|nr:unnamed protein product [Pieris macdunnoughi]